MKKLRNIILAIVLIAAVLFIWAKLKNPEKPDAPSEEPPAEAEQTEQVEEAEDSQVAEIEALEEQLLGACHALDAEGILDCVYPSYAGPIRTTMKLTGEDQVFDLLCQILGATGSADHTEVLTTLDTEMTNVEVTGEEAAADLHYTYEQDGKIYGADADVEFKYTDGRWYISSLKGK